MVFISYTATVFNKITGDVKKVSVHYLFPKRNSIFISKFTNKLSSQVQSQIQKYG